MGSDLAEARRLAHEAGKYDQAERLLLQLIQQPSEGTAVAELAEMYERLGEIEAAAEMYQRSLAAGGFSESEQKRLESRLDVCRRQRMSLVRFPVSVEAETETKQFQGLLAARQWAPAFTTLGRIVDRFNGTFLQRGSGQYLGVWMWARSLLDGVPEDGQAVYRDFVNRAWADTLADGSTEGFRRFANDQPGSRVAGPAFLAWADTLADEGRTALALGLLNRAEIEQSAASERRILWQTHEPSTSSAPGPSGTDDLPDKLGSGWRVRLSDGEASADLGIAAAAGRVFVYRQFGVEAYDAASGERLWHYRPIEPIDRRDVRRGPYGRSRTPRSRWAGALDLPAIVASPAGVLVVENYETRGEDDDHVVSVVTCLHSQTGAVRWRLADDPLFERLRVCSEPVYSGGKVFVTAASRGEYPEFWLCALDGQDGRVIWRKTIATSATPTRCVGRGWLHAGWSGPTLVIDGHILYYATQMGAVVAVDHDLGQPLWAMSYPRIPRCGPLSRTQIPLLERRTEPVQVTPRYFILLPRDTNGLLVVDRVTGKLERTIRSLDLVSLITADDDLAVVTTLAGEVRAYSVRDGKLVWSWSVPPGESIARPTVSGRQLLVPHGESITRLEIASGNPSGQMATSAGTEIRRAMPAGTWVAVSPNQLRAMIGQADKPIPPLDAAVFPSAQPMIACADAGKPSNGWRYEAYVGPAGSEAKMVLRGQDAKLIVTNRYGLTACSPDKRYERCWWRPFDPTQGVWAVETATDPPGRVPRGAQSILTCTDDRETVRMIDAMTGRELATGRLEDLVPIRSLHVSGQNLLVAGTSRLAMVRATTVSAPAGQSAAGSAGLAVAWVQDFTPRTFASISVDEERTTLLVQPGGGEPARLMYLDTATGKPIRSFIIAAPAFAGSEDDERRERRPVRIRRVQYAQDALKTGPQGYEVEGEGQSRVALFAAPIRPIGQGKGCLFIEIARYWGMVETATGRVTLLSPGRGRESPAGGTVEDKALQDWLRSHPGLGRDEEPAFVFKSDGLSFAPGDREAASEEGRRDRFEDESGGRLMLEGFHPKRIDRAGAWLLLHGEGGVVVLRKDAPTERPNGPRSPGKAPADLFEPPGVRPISPQGLALDGDISDWPADGWHRLSLDRHAWPPFIEEGEMTGARTAFQWAMDASAVWLAVRVEDGTATAGGRSCPADADGVQVLLTGYRRYESDGRQHRDEATNAVFSLCTVDSIPVGGIQTRDGSPVLARPVGTDERFEQWWARRYGRKPVVDDQVTLAVVRADGLTQYELRIDRSCFAEEQPKGFDIRVTCGGASLEWGGAIYLPAVFPPAVFLSGN